MHVNWILHGFCVPQNCPLPVVMAKIAGQARCSIGLVSRSFDTIGNLAKSGILSDNKQVSHRSSVKLRSSRYHHYCKSITLYRRVEDKAALIATLSGSEYNWPSDFFDNAWPGDLRKFPICHFSTSTKPARKPGGPAWATAPWTNYGPTTLSN